MSAFVLSAAGEQGTLDLGDDDVPFLVCEFSEEVVDIREQFPLLPVESTLAIAKAIGVRYPRYKTTAIPLVMTTDFLLTVKQPNGDFKSVARTIKYQMDAVDLNALDFVRTPH